MRPVLLVGLLLPALASAEPLIFDGEVPDEGPAYFRVPFEVPAGTREVEVRHSDLSSANILDFGVEDPAGMRGWGGGNEEAAVVGELAASRSYLAGPVPAGTWNVIIGKAKIEQRPAKYHLEIDPRTEPRLAPQPERRPYVPPPFDPAPAFGRFYAGDFHVHSTESGDARATPDEIAEFALGRGLDFVALSEHNTVSGLQLLGALQERHPKLLILPSVEFTTYAGHATVVGATRFVDFRMGLDGVEIQKAVDDFASQGAVFTIAHPVLDLGSLCIGCAWRHPVPRSVGAVEIATGGWRQSGVLFDESAIAFWDRLSKKGLHLTALGGSDDHRAGVGLDQTSSPVGDPTTLVQAREKSLPGILEGIKAGRTVVKLQSPSDPMIELEATTGERRGDTVAGESIHVVARLFDVRLLQFRWVKNGEPQQPKNLLSLSAVMEADLEPPETGEDFWRAEVLVDGKPRTLTSNLWVTRAFPVDSGEKPLDAAPPLGCGCGADGGGLAAAAVLALLGLALRSPRAKSRGDRAAQ